MESKHMKIVMLGDLASRKWSLVSSLTAGFANSTSYCKFGFSLSEGGPRVVLHIWDTPEDEKYDNVLARAWAANAAGLVAVYQAENDESLKRAKQLLEIASRGKYPCPTFMLVCRVEADTAVSEPRGSWDREACSETREGVEEVFRDVAQMALLRQSLEHRRKVSRCLIS